MACEHFWQKLENAFFWYNLKLYYPSLKSEGPKDLEIGKRNSTSSMACENFWQKPENVFFWYKLRF
jgi:hypothetical protein